MVISKREKERRAKNIKLRVVTLKNMIIDFEESTGIDIHSDIINFLEERIGKKRKM